VDRVAPEHPWLDRVDVVRPSGRGTYAFLPDAATMLVFRTTADGHSDLIVVGPQSRGAYHPSKPLRTCVRMSVRAGLGRHLFGVPVNELADRSTLLTELWGPAGRRLVDAVSGAPDGAAVMARLSATIRPTAAATTPQTALLAAAMRALSPGGDPRLARLSTLAGHLGLSDRHLRTVFARDVGLSPKQFARIVRLRHVLSRFGGDRWARLADEAGYFDQAHMIGDFRALMGVTPAAYAAGKLPTPTPCVA
jgi:AraC-like DNA-binding protein